jgi:hypothetical protein
MGKYKQASPLKFYLAKYFFLALASLQWLIAFFVYLNFEPTLKNQYTILIFFTIGAVMFVAFLLISDKVRRVAVGKKKLVVIYPNRKQKIDWKDIDSLELIPFINMYRLKQKGKKKGIYFFPSKNIDPVYGLLAKDTTKMGDFISQSNAS